MADNVTEILYCLLSEEKRAMFEVKLRSRVYGQEQTIHVKTRNNTYCMTLHSHTNLLRFFNRN